jgi:hypothetical protein
VGQSCIVTLSKPGEGRKARSLHRTDRTKRKAATSHFSALENPCCGHESSQKEQEEPDHKQ